MTNENIKLLTIYSIYGDELFQSFTSSFKELLEEAVRENANLNLADLSKMDLSGVYIDEADLAGATFKGSNLTGAIFSASNLDGCTFDDCELDDIYMTNDVSLNNASFTGEGNFKVSGGNFKGATMSVPKIIESNLQLFSS